MDTKISFKHDIGDKEALELDKLANVMEQDYDLDIKRICEDDTKGFKDGGLLVALEIIGTSIATIGLIISALEYWQSQQPKCSISLKIGNKTITIENIKISELKETIDQLEEESSEIAIQISTQ